MEPTAAPAATARSASPPSTSSTSTKEAAEGQGPRGSLESPEVYENVPGHVIPIIEREFDDFDTEAGGLPARRQPRTSSSASA